jgi:hypothetical protein
LFLHFKNAEKAQIESISISVRNFIMRHENI